MSSLESNLTLHHTYLKQQNNIFTLNNTGYSRGLSIIKIRAACSIGGDCDLRDRCPLPSSLAAVMAQEEQEVLKVTLFLEASAITFPTTAC